MKRRQSAHGVSPNFSKPDQAGPSRAKENQGKPRKKSLDFFGFLRPNRDFSISYGDSKEKNLLVSENTIVLAG
jgi:hypothetical protein